MIIELSQSQLRNFKYQHTQELASDEVTIGVPAGTAQKWFGLTTEGGEIVSVLMARANHKTGEAEISSCFTPNRQRGKGYGTELLQSVLGSLKSQNLIPFVRLAEPDGLGHYLEEIGFRPSEANPRKYLLRA